MPCRRLSPTMKNEAVPRYPFLLALRHGARCRLEASFRSFFPSQEVKLLGMILQFCLLFAQAIQDLVSVIKIDMTGCAVRHFLWPWTWPTNAEMKRRPPTRYNASVAQYAAATLARASFSSEGFVLSMLCSRPSSIEGGGNELMMYYLATQCSPRLMS